MAIHIACATDSGAACTAATAGNKIKTKASFSSSTIAKADGALSGGAFTPIATGPILKQQKTPAHINAEATDIKAALNKLEQIKPLTDSDIFTTSPKLREYVKTQIFNLQPAAQEQQAVATQITDHISKNYGKGSAGFTDKIWKAAKDIPLEYLTAKQIERKKLETVSDIDDLSTAVALDLSKDDTKLENTCETESIAKKHKDDCSAVADKTQCNDKPGCKYNEKDSKCEEDPAKTTAAETTSKSSDKKNQDECKDGCKWENNACKDSSISSTNNSLSMWLLQFKFGSTLVLYMFLLKFMNICEVE
ncbi:Trypanosome variant surface glycoprotein C-terminal domain containing protein, putative [Trypanosoma equiperdum]|uniref:Trypanosome variant surface glycoprotein C-terminal domain containing protein, putative n=1 Tax=Trypanosoma equiperdum TaxID=5694 RepID=A0A1G4HZU2_TRYEQ|nr:Trypanosome variant surface glycoprotein C-terminal domain containing protein, putative [Trypanosoma equiperdum]